MMRLICKHQIEWFKGLEGLIVPKRPEYSTLCVEELTVIDFFQRLIINLFSSLLDKDTTVMVILLIIKVQEYFGMHPKCICIYWSVNRA